MTDEVKSDPFAPENLRLSQDFTTETGVKKLITTIPVRRPNKQDFVRVHRDPSYRMDCGLIELKEEREIYLVTPAIAKAVAPEVVPVTLFTAINRQGVIFLWPVKFPPPGGRAEEWSRSAREAAEKAMESWIRVKANMSLGAYEIFPASGAIPEPDWPDLSYRQLLEIAFRGGKLVDSLQHPLLRRLRGET